MGHQATFFITADDTRAVETALRETGDFAILHSRSPTATPREVEHLDFSENGKPWLFLLLVLREHLADVQTRHVPEQGYWTIDVLTSPVVEFNRSFFDGRIIRPGRIYYVDGYYASNDVPVEKPEAFRSWAARTLRVVKKILAKRGSAYVGSAAAAWLDAGGSVDPPYQAAMLQKPRRKAAP